MFLCTTHWQVPFATWAPQMLERGHGWGWSCARPKGKTTAACTDTATSPARPTMACWCGPARSPCAASTEPSCWGTAHQPHPARHGARLEGQQNESCPQQTWKRDRSVHTLAVRRILQKAFTGWLSDEFFSRRLSDEFFNRCSQAGCRMDYSIGVHRLAVGWIIQ